MPAAAKSTATHQPVSAAPPEPAASKPSAAEPRAASEQAPTPGPEPSASETAAAEPAQAAAPPSAPEPRSAEAAVASAAPAATAAVRPPAPPPQRHSGPPGPPNGRPVPISRNSGKDEIFAEGDHVVYPTHGVGRVEKIATEEIAGHRLQLIHITFEENRMTLRVPVEKARSAGLRKLATRKLFDDALNVLRGRARIKRTMWSRRAQEYEAKINSGDPLAIAEVVRDLHRNAGQPDQSFSERQIYEAAMDRLAAELGALDKTDKATAATKLADFLKTVV
jgi:CarD family transcriptional regulator